jgi:hypothetical protein
MDVRCTGCHALHWASESSAKRLQGREASFESCCKHGDAQVEAMRPLPEPLNSLMSGVDAQSRAFRGDLRRWNSLFAFTSIKFNMDNRTGDIGGTFQLFQVHGALYHRQGPLVPAGGRDALYSQIYLYDPALAARTRADRALELDANLILSLTLMLQESNPLIQVYLTARERFAEIAAAEDDFRIILNPQLNLVVERGADLRRENLPMADEVSMILPEEYGRAGFRDIVLARRSHGEDEGNSFTLINPNHAAYLPLQYVLLFPHGEHGWHWGRTLLNREGNRQNKNLSQRVFYRFRLHTRPDEPATLFQAQRLFQQFVVDAWAVCDQNKLAWLRSHQASIRADLYNGLADVLEAGDVNLAQVGRRVVLPSSYLGGDRFMQQMYQDSIAIVRHYGKPTLFITFTANPKWVEIERELLPNQTAADRPDLVARVFNLKVRDLLDQIRHKGVFGPWLGWVWTIEYQKRGLPHLHLLVFLKTDHQFLTAANIDRFISAEIPTDDDAMSQELRAIIQSTMVHSHCAGGNHRAPCMQGLNPLIASVCRKGYPRQFQEETSIHEDGYPSYRRRNTGQTFTVAMRGSGGEGMAVIDNRRVVPYSPYLSLRYRAHINVEVCGSVKAVKYIHKYIYKGGDRATATLDSEHDEIKRYLHGRYIGPTEAVWRLFEFSTHEEQPPVTHLALHLPGEQPVYFSEQEGPDVLRQHMDNSVTTLLAYFKYNAENADGRAYLYHEFPEHYVYQRKVGWKRRTQRMSIGRMYSASPFMGERYYLRLLLTVVRGAQSFVHLRTVDGVEYPTFKGACVALRLLEDDGEWVALFNDGREFMTGRALRQLFALALQHTTITNPLHIWEEFGESFCDDLERLLVTGRVVPPAGAVGIEVVGLHQDYGLYHIQRLLNEYGRSVEEFGLPRPVLDWQEEGVRARGNGIMGEELGYNVEMERGLADRMQGQLNEEQVACFNDIVAAVELYEQDPQQQTSSKAFFLHGPAGTGKTFLYNCLCSHLRAQGKIVLCVASSGIAAQLLPGGRTAHSRFKIPLSNDVNAVCNITRNSPLAELIRNTSLIIWDEVPMQHKACFEAVNRTLNDVCNVGGQRVFGGIPTVLGGDFAQILPVVRRGTRQATVLACIQHGSIWEHLKVLKLKTSMRVIASDANGVFLTFLHDLVANPLHHGQLQLPGYIRQVSTVDQLCDLLYPQALLNDATTTHCALIGRAILAFRNDTVNDFNNVLLERMPGQEHQFEAVNHVAVTEDAAAAEPFAAEYLQSLNLASIPPSCLKLKIGVPVMLIRNLSPREGLCNGTRMRVVGISRNCLQVAILGGKFDGEIRLLPRIKLTTTDEDLPFILERTQFPVRPCFAMTVNKSQGQSLEKVGVDIRTNAFTHGQLYVALSRVTSLDGLTLLPSEVTPTHTDNVVYPEVLL